MCNPWNLDLFLLISLSPTDLIYIWIYGVKTGKEPILTNRYTLFWTLYYPTCVNMILKRHFKASYLDQSVLASATKEARSGHHAVSWAQSTKSTCFTFLQGGSENVRCRCFPLLSAAELIALIWLVLCGFFFCFFFLCALVQERGSFLCIHLTSVEDNNRCCILMNTKWGLKTSHSFCFSQNGKR